MNPYSLKRISILTCLAFVCAAVISCGRPSTTDASKQSEITELNFGIVGTESTVGLRAEIDPFLSDMSEALGIPVNTFFASDYAGVIEAMRFGKVDMGWFGNKSAIEAVDRAGGEVFAQTVPARGEAGYWSTIIVHADSPYKTIDELLADASNLSFGNGDPHSTSGFLIPSYYLWRAYSIDPQKTFKAVINSNHETNALSVVTKKVDFATCSTEVLFQLERERPELFEQLRVIWKSPLIPADPFVWRKALPDSIKDKIRSFVLSYGREGADKEKQLEVLSKIAAGWIPFQPSSDDQLLPLREMIMANQIDELERVDPESNAKEIEELKAKLLDVKKRRAELEQREEVQA